MKLKTLLLSSATAFAMVGGAQAADLSIAEPVDYVRVCDAIGAGYWYIPGSDTCLKIGGYVLMDVNLHANSLQYSNGSTSHSAAWDFKTEMSLTATAKSMTEYGILTGFLDYRAKSSNQPANDANNVYFDSAYLELGPVLAGHLDSTYDPGGSHVGTSYRSDSKTDQIRLSWAMSGFGLMLAVEDPVDRWGTSLPTSYSMPDIVGAITLSSGDLTAKISAGFAQLITVGSVYGVNGNLKIKLDSIAPGDELKLNAAFGTGSSFVGGGTNTATNWSMYASLKHFWSPTVSSSFSYSYLNHGTAANSWSAGANLVWAPVSGFSVAARGVYTVATGGTGAWSGRIRLKRKW